jgi:hypothetical protein
MNLKTMEIMGLDKAEILRKLKGQRNDTKKTVKELERRIKAEAEDRQLRQDLYKAMALMKELDEEISKRKIGSI